MSSRPPRSIGGSKAVFTAFILARDGQVQFSGLAYRLSRSMYLTLVAVGPLELGDAGGLHERASLVVGRGSGTSAARGALESTAALLICALHCTSDAGAPSLQLSLDRRGLGEGSKRQDEGGEDGGFEHCD